MVGEPINASTGNEFHEEDDYIDNPWLAVRRYYNSDTSVAPGTIGSHWHHSFDRMLSIVGSTPATIVAMRPDGGQEIFSKANGLWTSDTNVADSLTEQDNASGAATSYTLFIAASRQYETYSVAPAGMLQSVVDGSGRGITLSYSTSSTPKTVAPWAGLPIIVADSQGHHLGLTYNSAGNVSVITLPDGGTLTYGYDDNKNLTSVQYPDGKAKQYVYNEATLTGGASLPNALTGTIDEAGVRYENMTYSGTGSTQGQAISSSLAGNVAFTQVTYNSNGTSTVTYPLGISSTIAISPILGVGKIASLDQPCGPQCSQPYRARSYDANGYPASYVDFNANTTTTTYSNNGLLTQQIDAQGQPTQRITNFTWNTALRVPLTRAVLDYSGSTVAYDSWVYNTFGQATARCTADPSITGATSYICGSNTNALTGIRQWRYTYCTAVDTTRCPLVGLLLSVDGPRTDISDITNYSYYLATDESGCGTPGGACHRVGDLYQVTNALSQVTNYVAYDKNGRVVRQSDDNGVITDLTYSPRGWLLTRTLRANTNGTPSSGDAITTISYTPYGSVASITDADGVTASYTYDAAHRLTNITDALGDRIHYTLDAAGNKTQEQTFDPSGMVRRTLSRTYNTLGQLTKVTDGLPVGAALTTTRTGHVGVQDAIRLFKKLLGKKTGASCPKG